MSFFRNLLLFTTLLLAFSAQASTQPQTKSSVKRAHAAKPAEVKVASVPAQVPFTRPQVRLLTNQGEMVIELYPDKAPKTVENFLHYVDSGYYKGTVFHRVVKNFVIQAGGFTPDFKQKETFAPIPIESDNGLRNEEGTVAMARGSDPNSANSQFFINLDNNLHLNFYKPQSYYYGHCVFGKVIKGLDVAKKIAMIPTSANGPFEADVPKEPIVIEDVSPIPTPEQKTENQPTPTKDATHG
jgi:cyclophilin family peptidyl-prolyl cis-trans isomerase